MQGEASLCRGTVPWDSRPRSPAGSCLQKVELAEACSVFVRTAEKQGRKESAERRLLRSFKNKIPNLDC